MLPTDGNGGGESECAWYQVQCKAEESTSEFVGNAMSNSLENIAEAVTEAVAQSVAAMGAGWVFFDTPDVIQSGEGTSGGEPSAAPPDPSGLETILGWVAWTSLGICVLSLMAAGAMMAVRARRGEGGEHLSKIVVIMVATVLIGASSAIARGLLGGGPPDDASGPVQAVQSHLWWYVGAAVVLSVIIGAAKMAWEQRADAGKDLVRSLITLVVVSGAGLTVITIATRAADNFAQWLVIDSSDSDFGERVLAMLALGSGANPVFGVMLVIVLGSVAMFLSLIQMILMLIRDGMLVLLAAILPLAASFTNTEMGQSWFKKACAWLVAFILYKPAAAIVYAIAFQMVGAQDGESGSPSLINVVTGLTLMLISLIALPALMKFVVPMASLAGGGAAAGALGGVAAALGGKAGEMASGAISKGQGAAESETGGGGAPPPTGGGQDGGQGGDPNGSGGQGGDEGGDNPEQNDGAAQGAEQTSPGAEQAATPTGAPGGGEMATSGGAGAGGAGAAGAAAGGAGAALEAAERVKEAGDAAAQGAKGTIDEATEGPDGSN